jgi:hypothetical protein
MVDVGARNRTIFCVKYFEFRLNKDLGSNRWSPALAGESVTRFPLLLTSVWEMLCFSKKCSVGTINCHLQLHLLS